MKPCPVGMKPLFSKETIHQTHYLLFITAIMHIVFTCSTFYLTLARVGGRLCDAATLSGSVSAMPFQHFHTSEFFR